MATLIPVAAIISQLLTTTGLLLLLTWSVFFHITTVQGSSSESSSSFICRPPPEGLDAIPPVIRLLHAASTYTNASEALAASARQEDSRSTTYHHHTTTTINNPFSSTAFQEGMRALTRLNTWSSDTLMAECYGKANVWLRGSERFRYQRRQPGGRGGTTFGAQKDLSSSYREPGIMSVDVVSRTDLAVGLSRDLVKLQEAFRNVHKTGATLVATRSNLLTRLIIDLPHALRGIDAASSPFKRAAMEDEVEWSKQQQQQQQQQRESHMPPPNATNNVNILAATTLGLLPQQTRGMTSILGAAEDVLIAGAEAGEALDTFAGIAEAIWQRANVSITMCAERWMHRQQREVTEGGARIPAATPHAHTVIPIEKLGGGGGGGGGSGGGVEGGDDGGGGGRNRRLFSEEEEEEVEIAAAAADVNFRRNAPGSRRSSTTSQRKERARAAAAASSGSSGSSSTGARQPTQPTEVLQHIEDSLSAAQDILREISGSYDVYEEEEEEKEEESDEHLPFYYPPHFMPAVCQLRASLVEAVPSMQQQGVSSFGPYIAAASAASSGGVGSSSGSRGPVLGSTSTISSTTTTSTNKPRWKVATRFCGAVVNLAVARGEWDTYFGFQPSSRSRQNHYYNQQQQQQGTGAAPVLFDVWEQEEIETSENPKAYAERVAAWWYSKTGTCSATAPMKEYASSDTTPTSTTGGSSNNNHHDGNDDEKDANTNDKSQFRGSLARWQQYCAAARIGNFGVGDQNKTNQNHHHHQGGSAKNDDDDTVACLGADILTSQLTPVTKTLSKIHAAADRAAMGGDNRNDASSPRPIPRFST